LIIWLNVAKRCEGGGSALKNNYISYLAYSSPEPFNDISAAELVSQMKLGWNLGNTLDATDLQRLSRNSHVFDYETGWGNPITTKENIDAIKAAGFDSIRIPVSWAKVANSDFIIRSDWLDRVTEIVNYADENDMFIIINTHHDEGIFKFTNTAKHDSLDAFKIIWGQIAVNFKNYNEKLIFEALNEPRTKGSRAEWSGGTAEEHIVLNEYYKVFVDLVRKSGGNNDKRILLINTYAASVEAIAVDALVIPADTAKNKIAVSVHAYAPWGFCFENGRPATEQWSVNGTSSSGPEAIHTAFDRVYDKFVSAGYPVIMGEFGAVNKNNNTGARAAWAEYYVGYARKKGIPCFIWDNGIYQSRYSGAELFGFFNRNTNQVVFPEVMQAMKRGAGI